MKKTQFLYIVIALFFVIGGFVWYKFKVPKFANGQAAKDFQTVLRDGSTVRLSDLRGKFVLLQFWGSWCGPCRRENPAIVEIFKKYNSRGFEIFSIGIEQSRDRWEKAIEKDGMAWRLHTTDLQMFDGAVAKTYGVWQIPSTWLIDPDGRVIGVNLLPEKIEQLLASRL